MWAGWACKLSAGRTLLYWQSCSWPTATRGGRPSPQLTIHKCCICCLKCLAPAKIGDGCYIEDFINTKGYCSIDQGRLAQEMFPHLYCNCIGITVSLAHPAALHPSLVRLHSGFPLSVSIQCFHDRSARTQLVLAPSEWNLQVGVCTVAYSRYQGGNKLMDWKKHKEIKIQYLMQ